MTADATHLEGHREPTHPLSIRTAVDGAMPLARYGDETLWAQDGHLLPGHLRRYRAWVRDFARRELRPRALEFDIAPHDAARDAELLAIGAKAGLLTDMLPWPLGSGPWLRFRHSLALVSSIKLEELCAACGGLGLLLGAHVLGTAPLLLSGDARVIMRMLAPAYRRTRGGEPTVLAFAITEPSAGSDVEETHGASLYTPRTIARRVEGGYRITGRKVFISGGDLAHAVVVFAALEGEGMESWTAFFVKADSPGFSVVRNELKMGQRASAASELELENVFVSDADVVGKPRGGWGLNRVVLNFSRIPVAAIALGIARGAMESAIDFVTRFELGGQPLVHYQEVQLALAQMQAETNAMRAMIWQAARRYPPTQAKASMAKLHCGDRAVEVCNLAMDLLGNHAVLHGNFVEKHFRDSRLCQIYEGTNQINRLAVIEDLQAQLLERARGQQAT